MPIEMVEREARRIIFVTSATSCHAAYYEAGACENQNRINLGHCRGI
jgi:hypothetical protein